jgi:hypothetical protein
VRTARVAWGLFGTTLVLLVPMVVLSAGREEAFDTILYGVLTVAFSGTGALIVSTHPRNTIGWVFLALGASGAGWEVAEGWGHYATDEDLPGGAAGEWVILWSWIVDFAVLTVVFFLFPNGRMPSPRWRPWLWALAAGTALALPGQALSPDLGSEFASGTNPVAVESLPTDLMLNAGLTLMLVTLGAAVVSLVVRFRRGGYVERQQLKWIATAASLLLTVGVVAIFLWYETVLVQIAFALALVSLPLAVGVAILRHRLYDIDLVIRRTVVYGAVTATLAAAYLGSVLVLQLALSPLTEDSDLAIAGSTLAVAALFRPARARIQRTVDRRFYRRRYDASRTLDSFGARVRDHVELDSLGAELRSVVAETMQPAHVSLWLRKAAR